MDRSTLLVGSLPFDDAREAMTVALEELGDDLHTLPDGETGPRSDWILHIIESFRDHPDLELVADGNWSDYDDLPRFKVRRGHTLYGASLDLGHVDDVAASLPVFRELREHHGPPDLALQVGVPGDLDMALFTLGPVGLVRHRRAFTEAALAEINAIHEMAGDDVVFQVEVPAELVFVARAPARLQPVVAGRMAAGLARLAQAAPAGARFGIHLCLGDMNHRALGRMDDLAPVVHLANALAERWPSGRPLEYVHAPLGAADLPPSTDPTFVRPLADLELGAGTRFVAGLVHEHLGMDQQRELLARVDRLVGSPVDVAAACGLGRRDRDGALDSLRRAAALSAA